MLNFGVVVVNLEVGLTKAAIFVELRSFLEQKEAYAISGGVWEEEDRNMRMWVILVLLYNILHDLIHWESRRLMRF